MRTANQVEKQFAKTQETIMEDYEEYLDTDETPTPEKEVEPSGEVSPRGEELPEGVAPENNDDKLFEEEEPSKIEEPEKVIGETEEPELSETEKRFNELGLSKQFPGGVSEMIERVPNMNKYITDLEHQRKALREATPIVEPKADPVVEKLTADALLDSPNDSISHAVRGLTDAKFKAIEDRLAKNEYDAFVSSKSDFRQLESIMEQKLNENPGLAQLGVKATPILYDMAKAQQLSELAAKPTPATPAPVDKGSATTSVGKKGASLRNPSEVSHSDSLKEMEAKLGFAPER